MPLSELIREGEPDAASSWRLPAILQEVEAEAGASFVLDLIKTYQSEAAERIDIARAAARSGDREGLRKHCHSLNGSSRQMGANRLAAMYEQLERSSADASLAEIAAGLDVAAMQFQETCRVLGGYDPSNQRLPQ